MREIKFRVWDKERKEWIKQTGNPYVFPFEGRVAMTCRGQGTGYIGNQDYSQFYELSQYTGLKDKNGREIFEGDIVRTIPKPDKNGNFYHVASVNGCSLRDRVITWIDDQAQFGWRLTNGRIEGTGFTLCKSNCESLFEVIGNIYENPGLLEDLK